MASKLRKIEVRSFQVGFGDCFLLSFIYGGNDARHVLIDFGTTGLPKNRKGAKVHMPKVAEAIRKIVAPGRLTALIATHRHADHISGLATDTRTGKSGDVIRALRPRVVIQPWTEHPDAQPKALSAPTGKNLTKDFVATLEKMNALAGSVDALMKSNPTWMSAAARNELSFLGEDNIKNKSAVENLIAMGKAPGAKAEYLRYGDKSALKQLLPGVKVHILGPPDLTQSDDIRSQRAKDQDEFWHLMRGVVPLRPGQAVPRSLAGGKPRKTVPVQARWFRDRLQNLTEQSLLGIVRQLDAQMNNTSLIILFETARGKLLFPGDAQIENWSYALLNNVKDRNRNRALLADVDFYKVGHHGSLNATPRKLLWDNFKKRKGAKLATMISTMGGKHGKRASKTEVPRRTLMDALQAESQLKNTQDLRKVSEIEWLTEL